MAVLLVEQFATLALGVADEAAVLASGRMTFAGPAAELAASPALLHQAYLGTGAASG
jgi:branched-chain amino acid transport system ATP-binding protein